jgi:hypothetical protein
MSRTPSAIVAKPLSVELNPAEYVAVQKNDGKIKGVKISIHSHAASNGS